MDDEKRKLAEDLTKIVQIWIGLAAVGFLLYYFVTKDRPHAVKVFDLVSLGLGLIGFGVVHVKFSRTMAYLYNMPARRLFNVTPEFLRIVGLLSLFVGLGFSGAGLIVILTV